MWRKGDWSIKRKRTRRSVILPRWSSSSFFLWRLWSAVVDRDMPVHHRSPDAGVSSCSSVVKPEDFSQSSFTNKNLGRISYRLHAISPEPTWPCKFLTIDTKFRTKFRVWSRVRVLPVSFMTALSSYYFPPTTLCNFLWGQSGIILLPNYFLFEELFPL